MNGLPEAVTGTNVCPKCKGERVLEIPWTAYRRSFKHDHKECITLWGSNDKPYQWCDCCGGEGTASAALERVLIK